MKKFRVQVAMTIWKTVTVSAKNERQADARAKDKIAKSPHKVKRKDVEVQYTDEVIPRYDY